MLLVSGMGKVLDSGKVKSVFFVFIVWWKFLRGIHAIPVNLIVVMLWVNVLLLHFMNFISLLQSFFEWFFYELNKYSFQTELSCYHSGGVEKDKGKSFL